MGAESNPVQGQNTPTKPKRSWLWWPTRILLVFLLLVILDVLLFPLSGNRTLTAAKKAMAYTMTTHMTIASTLFKEEYGHYPPITDNEKLHQLLDGNMVDNENPRRIQFMSFNKKDNNSKGEICDPWKMPYRITYDDKGPLITSAGPDKKFDTKDDITNRDSR